MQTKDERIAVSLRSKGDRYNVAEVARRFGGGGHRNAAGFKLPWEPLEAVRRRILAGVLPLVD